MSRGALVLVMALGGCALAHQRESSVVTPRVDAATSTPDAGPPPRDVGPVTSCTDFWVGLSACPASPERAIGMHCSEEGATCGVHCCEPGPPIGCHDGTWLPLSAMDDCSGVRCRGPTPCFDGHCAAGRVCLRAIGEWQEPLAACVVPPAPIDRCEDAPPGAIRSDPGTCQVCTCAPGPDGFPVVTLDCPCC